MEEEGENRYALRVGTGGTEEEAADNLDTALGMVVQGEREIEG